MFVTKMLAPEGGGAKEGMGWGGGGTHLALTDVTTVPTVTFSLR